MIRALDRWLPSYLRRSRHRPEGTREQPTHIFIAVCDHFEPFHQTNKAGALKTLSDWEQSWPSLVAAHSDSSGRGPRHTFFYPIEQYDEEVLSRLTALCHRTGSEVEIHLHHANDTVEGLTALLQKGIQNLTSHGLLSINKDGHPRYGFIHGNWALDNSHPKGKHCGVDAELAVLKTTGCYADFTLPSAPDPTQTRLINSIYYAREDGSPASHAHGIPARTATTQTLAGTPDHLLLIQGPLGLNWNRRKFGLLPRIENADLTQANPPTLDRFFLWTQICPFVQNGPPWIFVKLHTHGGIARNYKTLLGEPSHRFHLDLAAHAKNDLSLRYHYVTAREMTNLVHAAESGTVTDPVHALDWLLPPPPMLQSSSR